MFQVSRATVREAIRIVQARGLVVAEHGVGVRVVDSTAAVAADAVSRMLSWKGAGPKDIFEVRLMLECHGAELAASRATEEEIEAIAAAIEEMATKRPTLRENVELDFDFHLRVAESSHNLVLVTLLNSIKGLLFDSISAAHAIDGRSEVRIRFHDNILQCIRDRDSVAAYRAMRAHLDETIELVSIAEASSAWLEGGGDPPR